MHIDSLKNIILKRKQLVCFLLGISFIILVYFLIDGTKLNEDIIITESEGVGRLSLSVTDSAYAPLQSPHLNLDEEVEYNIEFTSDLNDINEYMFFIVVDNEVQDFFLGEDLVSSYRFKLDNDEVKHINFNFPDSITSGFHSGLLVFVPEPEVSLDKERGLKDDLFIARFTMEKNHLQKDDLIFNEIGVGQYKTNYQENDFQSFLIYEEDITQKSPIIITEESITNRKELAYNISKSNVSNHETSYIVIALKDWSNVDINGLEYLYFTLEPNQKIEVPIRVDIDNTDINKELVFLLIENPEHVMDHKSMGVYMEQRQNIQVFTSQRILLKE